MLIVFDDYGFFVGTLLGTFAAIVGTALTLFAAVGTAFAVCAAFRTAFTVGARLAVFGACLAFLLAVGAVVGACLVADSLLASRCTLDSGNAGVLSFRCHFGVLFQKSGARGVDTAVCLNGEDHCFSEEEGDHDCCPPVGDAFCALKPDLTVPTA